MINAPVHIKDLKAYIPGKPMEELERELGLARSVKLASNENPLGPSPLALEEAQAALSKVHRYPDGNGFYLRNALAAHCAVNIEEIILGNGSNELIDIAARTYLVPGQEAVFSSTSFPVYLSSTIKAGGTPVVVPLKDYRYDLQAMADRITGRTRIVFIANPNNPTGTIVDRSDVDEFMEALPQGVLVVMDEAYYEYVTDASYPDSLGYVRQGRDMLVLRTFSKAYGLAGLRIGYGMAPAPVIGMMKKVAEPFNTSSVAQAAALGALKDTGHLAGAREINEQGKEYLYRELDALSLRYVKTHTNFIYIDLGQDAGALYEKLLRQGVIVRPMGPAAIRLTIGLPDENTMFIDRLKEVL